MIFPHVHIAHIICEYLSMADLRNLLCVNVATRNTVRSLTGVRSVRHIIERCTYAMSCITMNMFRLNKIVRCDYEFAGFTTYPRILSHDYTGLIEIEYRRSSLYTYARSGMTDTGILRPPYRHTLHKYVLSRRLHFTSLIDLMFRFMDGGLQYSYEMGGDIIHITWINFGVYSTCVDRMNIILEWI